MESKTIPTWGCHKIKISLCVLIVQLAWHSLEKWNVPTAYMNLKVIVSSRDSDVLQEPTFRSAYIAPQIIYRKVVSHHRWENRTNLPMAVGFPPALMGFPNFNHIIPNYNHMPSKKWCIQYLVRMCEFHARLPTLEAWPPIDRTNFLSSTSHNLKNKPETKEK